MEKILLGADAWGADLKNDIREHLKKKGYEVIDIGTTDSKKNIPYYEIAATAAKKVQKGEVDKAVIFCGTGMGVSIVANKFKGIYASVIESEYTAKMCKVINNANILTMGGMIVSHNIAKLAVDSWLEASHTEGMEPDIADFLKKALVEIENIEEEIYSS